MKYFLTGAFITIMILISLFVYRQNIFSTNDLPHDDEQTGLDKQIIINFSHVVAENTPKGMAAEKFAQLVKEKSNGRVVVQVYPNEIMYNDENELQALRDNEVQMIAPTFSKLTETLPDWQVLDLPFIIETQDQLKTVLNGPLSEKLLEELDTIDVKGLTFWSNGFKQIASSQSPITNVEQFDGKRIRLMPSYVLEEQFKLLGATPVVTSFGDVYYDLQNEVVDAQENTISNIVSKRFHTMENNITLSNHGILCYAVMMNEQFWNGLDKKTQQIITESLEEMQDWQHEQAIKINNEDLKILSSDKNVNIVELDESVKNKWKAKVKPIYEIYTNEVNDHYLKELLQEIDIKQNKKNEQNEQK